MFGFQRIGDLIWAAGDMRCRGFLIGATAGRTTLQGEGLQHQDGHSHLHASTVPNCISYDAGFAYELAVIIQEGLRRMYEAGESVFYYLTAYNETYLMPAMPGEGVRNGILRGLYKLRTAEKPGKLPRAHLFGSGPLINEALRAQDLLRERYKVAADVWSATSYNELYRDALAAQRWNRLHPGERPRVPYIAQVLADQPWPVVATSDYVSSLAQRLASFLPAGLCVLGTDGFGRSDCRPSLRRHFQNDAEHMVLAALTELARQGQFDSQRLAQVRDDLSLDLEAPDPATA
jgi:pyruvate dehydrogenase E1 component